MKNFLYVSLLFLAFTQSAHADNLIGFGLKGGLTLSWQNEGPNAITDLGSALEPTAGLFTDVSLLGPLGLQLETNYIEKGSSIDNIAITGPSSAILGTGNFQYTYTYLEVPLLVKFQTELLPEWKGYLVAGPSLSFLLNETSALTSNNDPSANASFNDTSYYPSTYWSLDFGVGMELVGFLLDIRYNAGLDSASPVNQISRTYGQLNALSFQLGYRLF